MTTIAYRDGIMAADSQASTGEATMGDTQKIYVVNGHLVGMSGTARLLGVFRKWLETNLKIGEELPIAPNFLENAGENATIWAWVVTPERVIWKYEDSHAPWIMEAPFVASGSGRDFALGAMACGKTAVEAVEIAKQFDCYTGGTVRTIGFA